MNRIETLAEGVTLYLGDCREILPTLGKVDAVVTDPPYGIGFEYLSYKDSRENLTDLIADIFVPLRSIVTRMCITPGQTQVFLYPAADWISSIVWDTTGSFGHCGYSQWMPVLIYGKDVAGFGRTKEGMLKSDVIKFTGGGGVGFQREKDVSNHPCPKPLNVMTAICSRFTEPRETILDPFMGSGTIGVACVNLGRKFIGIEIESKYFDIACHRISEALKQPDMFIERPKVTEQIGFNL